MEEEFFLAQGTEVVHQCFQPYFPLADYNDYFDISAS
jgi:hypothetical protein